MSTQQERGRSYATTLEVRDTCLCLQVQRSARLLARRFDDALRPLGITHGQFSMLNALNRPEPARMASVAALLTMDRTTLTAALKLFERRGLVEIEVDPADARSRLVSLSPAGHKLLERAVPVWRRAHADLERELPTGGAARIRSSLRSLEQA